MDREAGPHARSWSHGHMESLTKLGNSYMTNSRQNYNLISRTCAAVACWAAVLQSNRGGWQSEPSLLTGR
eukprot:5055975-Pleurochrysis_carterae.AAC.1